MNYQGQWSIHHLMISRDEEQMPFLDVLHTRAAGIIGWNVKACPLQEVRGHDRIVLSGLNLDKSPYSTSWSESWASPAPCNENHDAGSILKAAWFWIEKGVRPCELKPYTDVTAESLTKWGHRWFWASVHSIHPWLHWAYITISKRWSKLLILKSLQFHTSIT